MNGWIVWNATAEVKVFHVYTIFMVVLLFCMQEAILSLLKFMYVASSVVITKCLAICQVYLLKKNGLLLQASHFELNCDNYCHLTQHILPTSALQLPGFKKRFPRKFGVFPPVYYTASACINL